MARYMEELSEEKKVEIKRRLDEVGKGSTNEPLLKNIKILKKL